MNQPISDTSPIVALSEVQASLGLFAEAVAGAPVPFEVVEPEACWPWCAGSTHALSVDLPAELHRRGFRSVVLHQLIGLHDDAIEAPSTIDRALFSLIYPLVEDIRIDAHTRRYFPGAVVDLDHLLELARAHHAAGERGQRLGANTLVESLHDRSLGGPNLAPDIEQILTPVFAAHADHGNSHAVAARLCELAQHDQDRLYAAIDDDSGTEPALPTEGAGGVSLDADGVATHVQQSDQLSGGHASTDALDDALPLSDDAAAPEDTMGVQLPMMRTLDSLAAGARTFVYDEWDYRAQQLRPAWCRVVEEALQGDDHGFAIDVQQRHQALRSRIRRSFELLRPTQLVRVHRSYDGEDVDIDAAIEAKADRRSGAAVDERLHIRRDRALRDVATAFLVDQSASTSSPAVPPEPEPVRAEYDPQEDPMSYGPIWSRPPDVEPIRRVIDVAKDAVALMSDALQELGDLHAIYGFSGTGRDHVDFKVAKEFSDVASTATGARIAEMRPLRYTRMGPAIRHAAAKLARQATQTKLLIVVSDGYPQDVDYGDDRTDRDYGVHDTAKAIEEAARQGIETFCVTIDPAGHDYLRVMCADQRYLVIEDVETLPEELAKLYVGLST